MYHDIDIMRGTYLIMYWVFPKRVLTFSFTLLLFLRLDMVYRVVGEVLETLEVELVEIMVVDLGLLKF